MCAGCPLFWYNDITNSKFTKAALAAEVPMTEKLYEKNVYERACISEIISCKAEHKPAGKKTPEADYMYLILSRTVFYPEGGGQDCDLGTINGFPVTDVREKDGEIVHKVLTAGKDAVTGSSAEDFPCSDGADPEKIFAEGSSADCRLDWHRRFGNMQRHCGEHILSGTFFRRFGGINHGFHMGENYMTIDIGLDTTPGGDVPGEKGSVIDFASLGDERWQGRASGVAGSSYDPKTILDAPGENNDESHGAVIGGEVTWEMAMSAERSANAIIWADLPVKTTYFATHDAALSMPLRKEMKVKNDISVVTIGSEFSPADCCACCGTHPSSAGQVGLIKIYKVEKNGDWWRIYFDAGMRAMNEYDSTHDTLIDICDRFSSGTQEIGGALDAYMRRGAETHERLARLLRSVISSRTSEIVSALEDRHDTAEQGTKITSLPTWYYDDLEIDDILRIGHDVQASLGVDPKGKHKESSRGSYVSSLLEKPICLVQIRESTVLLFSNGKVDCGKLVKENAGIYQGKGGGSRVSARAIFPGKDQVDTFLDLLEKHLR